MLARAKHHIAELDGLVRAYLVSEPYAMIIEDDPDTGDKVHVLKLVKPLPPTLNGIASDAVHNLRAALDQAGYAVAIANNGTGKYGHFPFSQKAADVLGHKTGSSKEIPDKVFDVMVFYQPYEGGNLALYALNQLSNANKHRILSAAHVVSTAASVRMTGEKGTSGFYPSALRRATRVGTEDKVELFRGRAGAEFSYDVKIASLVPFYEIESIKNRNAPEILDAWAGIIGSLLIAVDAEARRIGIFH